MYHVKRLDLTALDDSKIAVFEPLTEPKFRCCLRSQQPNNISNTTIIAIAATEHEQPVGLILASFFNYIKNAEVHSIFVKEPHRQKGVGTQLVSVLEEELHQLKCHQVAISYPQEEPWTTFLESILRKCDWASPQILQFHCRFDARTFLPEWIQREYKHSRAFTSFPWKQLSPTEKSKLENQLQQGVIPIEVSPFRDESTIEPINSLGLRDSKDVVGWMITHREAADTIRYTALFILPQYPTVEAIALLWESIWLQKASDVIWAILDLNVRQSPQSWIKFVQKRLFPSALSVTRTVFSWKSLD